MTTSITFAAFHVDLAEDVLDKARQVARNVTVPPDPCEMLRVMFQSCERVHPDCRKVVLTDRQSCLDVGPDVEVVRHEIHAGRPILARSYCWSSYLRTATGHTVFLDNDVLVQHPIDGVFAEPFDVGLTYRPDNPVWPINAGVQFFHGERIESGAAFMASCCERLVSEHASAVVWGGDQDVLRDVTSGADLSGTVRRRWSANGVEFLLLPCATHNYTDDQDPRMAGYYPAPSILHFKGPRKDSMLAYWRRLCSSHGKTSHEADLPR